MQGQLFPEKMAKFPIVSFFSEKVSSSLSHDIMTATEQNAKFLKSSTDLDSIHLTDQLGPNVLLHSHANVLVGDAEPEPVSANEKLVFT